MTIFSLLAAALLAQDAQTGATATGTPAQVDQTTFPVGGPFNAETPSVNVGADRIAIAPDGTWSRPFLVDGAWGDFKALFGRIDQTAPRPAYLLKVQVFDYATVIQRSPAGVARQQRSLIDGPELASLNAGLATFRAMVEGSLGGRFKVRLDVETDSDPLVVETGLGPPPPDKPVKFDLGTDPTTLPISAFGAGFAFHDVFPTFNGDLFETDDKVYRGPYSGVFVVHAGLTGRIETHLAGATPVSIVPYYRTGARPAKEALAANLYACWKRQVSVRASGSVENGPVADPEAAPVPWFGPTLEKLATEPPDPTMWTSGDDAGNACLSPNGELSVRAELADAVAAKFGAGVSLAGWSVSSNGTYARFKPVGTSAQALITELSNGPKHDPGTSALAVGDTVGDFACTKVNDANLGPCLEVKVKGRVTRGYACLSRGDRPQDAGHLNAQIKLSSDESLALLVRDANGRVLATVLIGGDTPGPDEWPDQKTLIRADVPADDQFHPVSVAIGPVLAGQKVADIVLSSPDPGGCERVSRNDVTVTLAGLAFAGQPLETAKSDPEASPALTVARIGDTPNAEETALLKAGLASSDATLKLTSLAVLARVKSPDLVPALAEALRSAALPVAYLASKALAFQGTTDALAELRATVERGPFDHNRWFAAAQLEPLADSAMVASLNFMTVKNRRARAASVRALAKVKAPMAGVVLSAMLMMEPNSIVKAEIVRDADTGIDLVARRMLFVAVNDPSEVVRGLAYSRLIDSKDQGIQSEALKGVKDESATVRIYLVDVMRQRAKESYRPALRTAVVDSDPRVRTMALRAFASQPGPVDPDEVKNTFSDPDPTVRKALEELAKAKGFKVPAP